MKNALDVLEEDGEIDLKKQDDRTIREAISETCARALQTAPLRTIPADLEQHQLGPEPLESAVEHLPASTRARALKAQQEQRQESGRRRARAAGEGHVDRAACDGAHSTPLLLAAARAAPRPRTAGRGGERDAF